MDPLPEEMRRFVDANIESIDQLEILRVLGEDRDREWTAATLAGEVQAKPQAVATHLAALQARGLLVATAHGTDLSCRHGAATPELEGMIGRMLQLYKERPVSMIKFVYERAKDPLRSFADAFRIRKEG